MLCPDRILLSDAAQAGCNLLCLLQLRHALCMQRDKHTSAVTQGDKQQGFNCECYSF